jgi:DNA-binding SARP family transcriptional activator
LTAHPPFRLQLFGTPALLRVGADGAAEVALPAGKPLLILAHLSAHPGGVSREVLATLGWGDQDDQRARASLRQAIYRLRQVLGPDLLDATDEVAALAQPIPSDRDDFLAAIAGGDDTGAVALYRGPFLAGIPSSDPDGIGLWDARERDRLAALWREAALREGERLRDAGEHTAAIALAVRLTDTFPDRAAVWAFRLAATTHPSTIGAHRDALAQLEAALNAGTLIGTDADVARQLLGAHATPPQPPRPTPPTGPRQPALPPTELPLVGRTLLLNRLVEVALGTDQSGVGSVVLLKGSAGLGKSRLLRELAARLSHAGQSVVALAAVASERSAAWAFLGHVVRTVVHLPGGLGLAPEHASSLLAIAPDLAARLAGVAPRDVPTREALIAATADLLSAAQAARPFTLLLDDLHFADTASLEVLAAAIDNIGTAGPTLIGGSRPGQQALPSPWPRWQVTPLTRDELSELWDRVLGLQVDAPMQPLAEATVLVTGGIPLYVARAIQQLEAAGLLLRDQRGGWRAPAFDTLPPAVAGLTLHRDPLFPGDRVARAVLGYCTAAREPVSRDELEWALTDASPEQIADVVDRLVIAGWVSVGEFADTITLTHAILGDQVGAAVGNATIDGWRQRHAQWLARHGTTLGQLQQLVQILAAAGRGEEAIAALRQWRRRTGQRLIGMAELLMPPDASTMFRARLRLALSPNAWVVPVALVIVMLAVVVGFDGWLRMPTLLRLENAAVMMPVREQNRFATWRSNDNPPVLRVYDRLGRPSHRLDGDTLVVTQQHGDARLEMTAPAVVEDGVVAALGLILRDVPGGTRDSVVATFRVGRASSRAITLFRPGSLNYALSFFRGTLAGQELGRERPTIRVAPGAPIEGEVLLRYKTPSDPITYILAESSTFGDPATDTVTVASLHDNATNGYIGVRVRRTAPMVPGTYWLAWITAPETTSIWVLSATNWRCGAPVWNDGNDLMARDDLASIWGGGVLNVSRLICDAPGQRERLDQVMPAATVQVIVE